MLGKKTVFVLGAGASVPYGFPTGEQLREEIISQTATAKDSMFNRLLKMGFDYLSINVFKERFIKSSLSTIDRFMQHEEDPKIRLLARCCIALCILSKEHPEKLDVLDWYSFLFEGIIQESFDNLAFDTLAFVTFNYDRSLEQFLYKTALAIYNKNPEETGRIINQIQIYHVYGKLGNLPWQQGDLPIPYTSKEINDTMLVKRSAEKIRISYEGSMVTEMQFARGLLLNAEVICFLGFGFDSYNMQQLNVSENNAKIMATCFGLSQPDISRIHRILDKSSRSIWLLNKNAKEAIRDFEFI